MSVPDGGNPDGENAASSPSEQALKSFGDGRFAALVRECHSPAAGERDSPAWAVVLLATNEEPDVLPYEITFRSAGRGWDEVSGSDTPGWRNSEDGQGFVTFWDRAPAGASSVTVARGDVIATSPVRNGYFLVVFWGVPEQDFKPDSLPDVTGSD